MKVYDEINFLDHVEDETTKEVIQEGTPLSSSTFKHMDRGIKDVTDETIAQGKAISDAQKEIKVLKDATLNNMVNNVFLKNFDSVNAVAITSGIYDPVAHKIYV